MMPYAVNDHEIEGVLRDIEPINYNNACSGVRVYDGTHPMIIFSFLIEGGAVLDQPGKEGCSALLAQLLTEGCGTYTAELYQQELSYLAIDIDFVASTDYMGGRLKTTRYTIERAFELFFLSLKNPRFDESAIERVKSQMVAELLHETHDPHRIASRTFYSTGFAGHPYHRPISGTIESIRSLTREDLIDLHRILLTKGKMSFSLVGDCNHKEMDHLLSGYLNETLREPGDARIDSVKLKALDHPVYIHCDVEQSVVKFGLNALSYTDEDFYAGLVLNHVLGGGVFTSRLFGNIREKKGMTYSIYSSLINYRYASLMVGSAATQTKLVEEMVVQIEFEINTLYEKTISEEELSLAKSYLTGAYLMQFANKSQLASQLTHVQFDGRGVEYIRSRNAHVNSVTVEEVIKVAKRLFQVNSLLKVVVGRHSNP